MGGPCKSKGSLKGKYKKKTEIHFLIPVPVFNLALLIVSIPTFH